MIVRSLEQVIGTDRDVAGDGWRSRRLLLARDGMGFSLHDTTVAAGAELELEYRHHLEACYCVEGSAEITDLATGARHHIGPGMVYALDQHDRHVIRVSQDLRLVCSLNRRSPCRDPRLDRQLPTAGGQRIGSASRWS